MTMSVKAFGQLKKLMQLTTSNNDPEALNALRRANALLAEAGVDWDRVFSRCVTVGVDVEAAPDEDRPLSDRISAAFEEVLSQDLTGDFATFVDSLHRQWETTGRLSPRQQEALFKAAERRRR